MVTMKQWLGGAAIAALNFGMTFGAHAATEVRVIVCHYSDQDGPYFRSHDDDILDADGKSGVASAEAVAAATRHRDLIDAALTQPGVTNYNRQDIESMLKQGKIGMIISAPWLRGQMKEEAPDVDYGIAGIPAGNAQATHGVTDSIVMFADSGVKGEVWKFLAEPAFTEKKDGEASSRKKRFPAGLQIGGRRRQIRRRPRA